MSDEVAHAHLKVKPHVLLSDVLRKWLRQLRLLGKVGQVLDDLGNESQSPRCAVIRILLHEVEETGRHDGRAQKTEKQRGADEPLADVLLAAVQALLLPGCKHFFQLTRKNTGEERKTKGKSTRTQKSPGGSHCGPTESDYEEGIIERTPLITAERWWTNHRHPDGDQKPDAVNLRNQCKQGFAKWEDGMQLLTNPFGLLQLSVISLQTAHHKSKILLTAGENSDQKSLTYLF